MGGVLNRTGRGRCLTGFLQPRLDVSPAIALASRLPRVGSLRRFNRDDERFGNRLIAAVGRVADRDQDVRLGIIGGGAAAGNFVGDHLEAFGPAGFGFKVADQIDPLILFQTEMSHVLGVEEDNPAALEDAAVTVVLAVDRRVELIVAAHAS